jgi:16S rRNA (guanine966-N2)-methyltransferase
MRVIAGKYRGRRLRAPSGRRIRPTSDRLRESIFNIIGSDIQDKNILDIFAGTGAMGIEALSRGAGHAVFIDKHPAALECIRANIEPLEIPDQWNIIRWDVAPNLHCLAKQTMRFGYAFIDPPYDRGFASQALENVVTSDAMESGGLIVLEHHRQEKIACRENRIALLDQRRYGKTLVSFLRIMV